MQVSPVDGRSLIAKLCERVVTLEKGQLVMDVPAAQMEAFLCC
jgi:ABC-type uncharacterized transport system ATPase subunit